MCTKLTDALAAIRAELHSLAGASLLPKRERLVEKLGLTSAAEEEIKQEGATARRETTEHTAAVLERSTAEQDASLLQLRRQSEEMAVEMHRIDRILGLVAGIKSGGRSMSAAEYLSRFSDTKRSIERESVQPEVAPGAETLVSSLLAKGVPREFQWRQEALNSAVELRQLLWVKDQMIWALLRGRPGLPSVGDEPSKMEADDKEAKRWAFLCNDLSSKLAVFQVECLVCGKALSPASASSSCRSGGLHKFVSDVVVDDEAKEKEEEKKKRVIEAFTV